jgi:hypothetical protein
VLVTAAVRLAVTVDILVISTVVLVLSEVILILSSVSFPFEDPTAAAPAGLRSLRFAILGAKPFLFLSMKAINQYYE